MGIREFFSKFHGADLSAEALPVFQWDKHPKDLLMQDVFRLLEARVLAAIHWYLAEKERKAFWSRLLRFFAVLGAAFGAITPLLAQMTSSVSLVWGYLALALAAFAVGMDRALGFSSTWLRYVRAAIRLQQILNHAQLEWAKFSSSPGNEMQIEEGWTILRELSIESGSIIRDETEEWATDTRSVLREIDGRANSQSS